MRKKLAILMIIIMSIALIANSVLYIYYYPYYNTFGFIGSEGLVILAIAMIIYSNKKRYPEA
jgi:hypothetical protein